AEKNALTPARQRHKNASVRAASTMTSRMWGSRRGTIRFLKCSAIFLSAITLRKTPFDTLGSLSREIWASLKIGFMFRFLRRTTRLQIFGTSKKECRANASFDLERRTIFGPWAIQGLVDLVARFFLIAVMPTDAWV